MSKNYDVCVICKEPSPFGKSFQMPDGGWSRVHTRCKAKAEELYGTYDASKSRTAINVSKTSKTS